MENETSYDVVIVGAGIAGAQMAYQLGLKNRKVLVLEAGDFIPNVNVQFPVKQNNINKYFASPIKDPSAPWPGKKDPITPWAESKLYAPRPTAPGVNSDNTDGVDWKDPQGNYLQETGKYAFGSTYERVAGGTTKHWLGTCLRFVPDDFIVMSKYQPPVKGGYDWPIGYDDLEKYYGQAENEIGVSGDPAADEAMGATHSTPYPMLAIPQSYLDGIFKKRLSGKAIDGNELNVVGTPQGRNSKVYDNRPACMGNTSCVPICPINAKYDAGVHINKTIALAGNPVTFAVRSVAYQVLINPSDDTVSGIKYKSWGPNPDDPITDNVAVGKIYVIASHAAETAKLLLNSAWKNNISVANSSDMVGRHLMDHICLVVWGNLKTEDGTGKEPVYPYRGPLSTSGIETFRNTNQRSKTAAFRIEIGNDGWSWPYGSPAYNVGKYVQQGLTGVSLVKAVQEDVQSQVRFALELETISGDDTMESRVTLSNDKDALGIPRPSVNYVVPQYTLDGYAYAIQVAKQLFNLLGVDSTDYDEYMGKLNPNAAGKITFTPSGSSTPITIEFRGAGHLIGTHRMGSDKNVSVVNKDLQTWDHSNLYLVGCGAYPSTATSNPTLTLAALALRAADTINKLLSPVS